MKLRLNIQQSKIICYICIMDSSELSHSFSMYDMGIIHAIDLVHRSLQALVHFNSRLKSLKQIMDDSNPFLMENSMNYFMRYFQR